MKFLAVVLLFFSTVTGTSVCGSSVTTSALLQLPRPIYDINTSGSSLLLLATTGEGASPIQFLDPVPPRAVYQMNGLTSTVQQLFTFDSAISPTQFIRLASGKNDQFYFNNIDGAGGSLIVGGDNNSSETYKSWPVRHTDRIAANKDLSLILSTDSSGTLSLLRLDPGTSDSLPSFQKLCSIQSGHNNNFDSLLFMHGYTFAVTFGPHIMVIDMLPQGPVVVKKLKIDVIPTLDGFRYPHRLFGYYAEKIYLLNGENSITVIDTKDWSYKNSSVPARGSITCASVDHDEIICASIGGDVLSLSMKSFRISWSVYVAPGIISDVVALGNGTYVACDHEGNLVSIQVDQP